jgi:predicted CXXCH cytochrome family protein
MRLTRRGSSLNLALVLLGSMPLALPARAWGDDSACLECHGSQQQVTDATTAMELKLDPDRLQKLVVTSATEGDAHAGLACVNCHPKAEEVPHPAGMRAGNPCATCHEDAVKQVNASTHKDPAGGTELGAPCWACHGAHDIRPAKDPKSMLHPQHVASRCLQCHDKREYLTGVHGQGVQLAGLDVSATCVSCHGGHDTKHSNEADARTTRRNISFTCGKCHGRVAEKYRHSVHGAALTESDNHDVPTCVDCHAAHGTVDPQLGQFRLSSPEMCARCHNDAAMMKKYGLSTDVFETYVADFHGTTAELFRATSPDQPLNQAVCYDCHGFHDIESVKAVGHAKVQERLLARCQVCHP